MIELYTNSKCELIVCGLPEVEEGKHLLEVLIFDEYSENYIYEWDRTENDLCYEMPKDGLYNYYYTIVSEKSDDVVKEFIKNLPDPDNNLFSLCKLRSCVLQKEQTMIENFANGCNKAGKCEKKDTSNVDILLIALYLLEHLVCIGEYSKASILLNKIQSCGGLCEDIVTKKCNC